MRLSFPLLPSPVRWFGVIAVAAVLIYFSLLTTAPAPPEPGPFWDKRLHFAGYLALGLAMAYATATSPRLRLQRALLVTATVVFGVGMEILQGPLPARYFSIGDIIANVTGALLSTTWFIVENRVDYVRYPRDR